MRVWGKFIFDAKLTRWFLWRQPLKLCDWLAKTKKFFRGNETWGGGSQETQRENLKVFYKVFFN